MLNFGKATVLLFYHFLTYRNTEGCLPVQEPLTLPLLALVWRPPRNFTRLSCY